jgi:hypothetical protein
MIILITTAGSAHTLRPVVTLMGGVSSPFGQQSQTLSFANTIFEYQPNHTSELPALMGGFIGEEYSFKEIGAWQFGLAFYQNASSVVDGEVAQAPMLSLDAVNMWNYHYKIISRQLLFENKIFLIFHKYYRPYLLIGLGEGFNDAHAFHVAPENAGEVATATFGSNSTSSFIYTIGLGIDIDISTKMRIGAAYHFGYLGKYNLGTGTLDTGAGGNAFSLPALKSVHAYNHQVFIQLTYLI